MSIFGNRRAGWVLTKGLVYSVEWIEPSRNDFGHYNVVFSYRVDGELYTGEFTDYCDSQEGYLRREDSIDVLYDPQKPRNSFYLDLHTATDCRLLFGSIGLGFALVVMVIVYLNSR